MHVLRNRTEVVRVIVLLLMLPLAGLAEEGAVTNAPPEGGMVPGDAERQLQDVLRQLGAARVKLGEVAPESVGGRLARLEQKALDYETLQTRLELRDKRIAELEARLKESADRLTAQETEMRRIEALSGLMTKTIVSLKDEIGQLKDAMALISKGRYEYYQVKAGDTCESIAEQPRVYGDRSKHVLIRQANRGTVADLDKLVEGEMLIIPRFTMGGNYEF